MSDELVTEETMNKWASLFGVVTENATESAVARSTQAVDVKSVNTDAKIAALETKVASLEMKQQQLIVLLMQISKNVLTPEEINKQLLEILNRG